MKLYAFHQSRVLNIQGCHGELVSRAPLARDFGLASCWRWRRAVGADLERR